MRPEGRIQKIFALRNFLLERRFSGFFVAVLLRMTLLFCEQDARKGRWFFLFLARMKIDFNRDGPVVNDAWPPAARESGSQGSCRLYGGWPIQAVFWLEWGSGGFADQQVNVLRHDYVTVNTEVET